MSGADLHFTSKLTNVHRTFPEESILPKTASYYASDSFLHSKHKQHEKKATVIRHTFPKGLIVNT